MCVEIVRLPPVVSARQRRSGEICGQDAQAAEAGVIGLHEPDKAGAKHGLGRGEECFAQCFHGREIAVDLLGEVGRRPRLYVRIGVDAAEEEMVVEGHAGNVEGVGFHRIAGKVYNEGLGFLVLELCTCKSDISLWHSLGLELHPSYPLSTHSTRQQCGLGIRCMPC